MVEHVDKHLLNDNAEDLPQPSPHAQPQEPWQKNLSNPRLENKCEVEVELEAELERIKGMIGMGFEVRVEWLPDTVKFKNGRRILEEVVGDTIRIYAEDPDNKFMPSPGTVEFLVEPSGPGIRLESGIFQGFTIPVHYDPIIAKLIVWAENRESCIDRMVRALDEYRIVGVGTTISFLRQIMLDDRFRSGGYNTHFLESFAPEAESVDMSAIAAIAAISEKLTPKILSTDQKPGTVKSKWKLIKRQRLLR